MFDRIRLAAALGALALALTACGGAAADPPAETTPAPVETTAAPVGQVESITIAGEAPSQITFTHTYARYGATILRQAADEPAFAEVGELLSAGEAARDAAVELLLDVTLTRETADNMPAEVTRRVQAGEGPDLLEFASASAAASLAPGGYLADLTALPTLALDHPAFDQALNRELTVAGHAYFLFGDATVGDKAATAAMLVDPTAAITAGIAPDELIDAVHAGDWTVETLLTLAARGPMSLDGDDVVPLFLAAGGKIFTRDVHGVPVLTTGAEFSSAYAAMQAVMAASADEASGSVFTVGTLADLGDGRIALPLPAAATGGNYLSPVDAGTAACVSVPASPADPARTGDILTAYFTESTETVAAPLHEHLAADTDAGLLERILASRTCALGALFGWGDLAEALTESVGMPEAEFLAAVEMRMTTAAKAMEIFLNRLG